VAVTRFARHPEAAWSLKALFFFISNFSFTSPMPRSSPPTSFFRRLLRPLPIIGMVGILSFVSWFMFGNAGVWSSHKLRKQKLAQAAEIRQLEAAKHQLEAYYAALKAQDVAALERAARERGLVAAGETIYEIQVTDSLR
jgi:cell division protein FtsB